ncbi:serine/threonine-protein phosphatase 2A 55 kDa regulatory subunit B delta isoform [Parus major]|uniref:serine/threonine-protein phosphatase 2A 55 kDa regulatory subunit B delta isoform n=1 Tax=Parus major TaxID=9157 RepID=UPI0008F4826E|nr:serine/threonine-protein phosphatase 2A 55 kDa regulatory subunit B delta isoform [Parus major]
MAVVARAGSDGGGNNEVQWCFLQVKGAIDEDVAEADIISTVEFNYTGDLLATGDKGGRVVIFQREQETKSRPVSRGEYNVYSTFQSHEPEFDYLKSLEIEEKINKIRWLPQQNAAHFLLSTNDKTIKLWKISERDKRAEGYNLKDEDGRLREPFRVTELRVSLCSLALCISLHALLYLHATKLKCANQKWCWGQGHVFIDDQAEEISELTAWKCLTETFLRKKLVTDVKFSSTENSGSRKSWRWFHVELCVLSAVFEEPEDPSSRSFFSEIISSISDVKFSHSGRYMMTRDYLSVKVWDLNMENRPVETYQVHEYLRSKLCSLYENDCIFDKFECCWNGSDSTIMTGSYNNFFRTFERNTHRDTTLEASRESSKPRAILKPRKVCTTGKRKKDEITVDSLDFNKKILHTAWHPTDNIIAVAATNNLYLFQEKVN